MTTIDIPGTHKNPQSIPFGDSLNITFHDDGYFFHDGQLVFGVDPPVPPYAPMPSSVPLDPKVKKNDVWYSFVYQVPVGAKIIFYFLDSQKTITHFSFKVKAP